MRWRYSSIGELLHFWGSNSYWWQKNLPEEIAYRMGYVKSIYDALCLKFTDEFEKINSRLTSIEESLETIKKVMDTFGNAQGSNDRLAADATINDLSHRVERMAILRFRTSVADFSILDNEIRQLVFESMVRDCSIAVPGE